MSTKVGLSENVDPLSPPRRDEPQSSVKPRVCHVVATTEGAPWMFEQLRELRDRHGFDVTAIVSGESGPLIDRLDAAGIPHFAANFEFGRLRGMLRMPGKIIRLARLFRQQRFDVVQTHIFVSMVSGRVAAWLADVPVRLSMISGPFHLRAHTPRWFERSTYWMETKLIPSCEESVRLCRELGMPEERLSLIYYSADESRFDPARVQPEDIRRQYGWPPDTPLIGMVAIFYPRLPKSSWVPPFLHGRGGKGHEDLVRVAPAILAEFPNAKFLLVGSGWGQAGEAYQEEVRELVRSLNLQEHVLFAGFHPDVRGILRGLDVAVQPSLDENLGGTLEALLMERPLVATRVGGMVDVVKDGVTGVLANPSDPDDLARAIVRMLREPGRARQLGRAGRELVLERFTLRRTAADLSGLYNRLLSEQKKRRKFHRPAVSVWRLIVAAPLFAYVASRLLIVDLLIPTYLPVNLARLRAATVTRSHVLLLRLYARLRGRAGKSERREQPSNYEPEGLSESD